jgi:hypothetical protein
MGSIGLAAWIALLAFWVLLVLGWRELGSKWTVTFVVLWCAGLAARSYVPYGADLFLPYVAVLDVVLVLMVVKGDVRLY